MIRPTALPSRGYRSMTGGAGHKGAIRNSPSRPIEAILRLRIDTGARLENHWRDKGHYLRRCDRSCRSARRCIARAPKLRSEEIEATVDTDAPGANDAKTISLQRLRPRAHPPAHKNVPLRCTNKKPARALSLLRIGNIPQKSVPKIALPLAPRSQVTDGAQLPSIYRAIYAASSHRPCSRNLAEFSLWPHSKRSRRATRENGRQHRLATKQARCLWDY
jgi:hypothetical protein